MLELDEVVRQNQLACLPFAKSGRAEADLHEQYPELAGMIERGRRATVDSMVLRSRLQEDELRFSGSAKGRAAIPDDLSLSPSAQKARRRSSKDQALYPQSPPLKPRSPALKPKSSAADLMFEMDEGEELGTERTGADAPSRELHGRQHHDQLPAPAIGLPTEEPCMDSKGKTLPSSAENPMAASPSLWPSGSQDDAARMAGDSTSWDNTKPWGSSALAPKLDMKEIMAQASSNRVSNLSAGLSLRSQRTDIAPGSLPSRLSQRERKKQQLQQAQQQQLFGSPAPSTNKNLPDETPPSPWQVAARSPKVSLKDVLGAEGDQSPISSAPSASRTTSIPPLTLRQTVPGKVPANPSVTSSRSTSHTPPQQRSVSSVSIPPSTSSAKTTPARSTSATHNTPTQSIPHAPSAAERTLQLSMADILSQQQAQKDIIKEAAAKRSLQEIQEEQAFQEWWDAESRKVRAAEEAARTKTGARTERGGRGKGRGGSRGRGRGRGGGRGGAESGSSGGGQGRGGRV